MQLGLVPVTGWQDARPLFLDDLVELANHAVVREKLLKVLQYSSRLIAFTARKVQTHWKNQRSNVGEPERRNDCPHDEAVCEEVHSHFLALSKLLSLARRCFKFLRWLKHFQDLRQLRAMGFGTVPFRGSLGNLPLFLPKTSR